MDLLIHKVSITDEAKFDYETTISPNFAFISKNLKEELEFYLYHNRRYHHKRYVRLKYYDDQSETELMFFLRESNKFASMKVWKVVGICKSEDWNEEIEDEGIIKAWLDTLLTPADDESDWVEDLRFRQAEEERLRKLDEKEQEKYVRLFGY